MFHLHRAGRRPDQDHRSRQRLSGSSRAWASGSSRAIARPRPPGQASTAVLARLDTARRQWAAHRFPARRVVDGRDALYTSPVPNRLQWWLVGAGTVHQPGPERAATRSHLFRRPTCFQSRSRQAHSLIPSKPCPAARSWAGRGNGGAQACRQGRGRGRARWPGGAARPARTRRPGLRGAGNNRAVSTATASSFLNAGTRAGGQHGRNGLPV